MRTLLLFMVIFKSSMILSIFLIFILNIIYSNTLSNFKNNMLLNILVRTCVLSHNFSIKVKILSLNLYTPTNHSALPDKSTTIVLEELGSHCDGCQWVLVLQLLLRLLPPSSPRAMTHYEIFNVMTLSRVSQRKRQSTTTVTHEISHKPMRYKIITATKWLLNFFVAVHFNLN